MSRRFKVGFWVVVAGQLALLLAVIGVKEQTLRTGTAVVLQAAPVDPRSLFQGDYVDLNYEISFLPPYLSDSALGATVYVSLMEKDDVWEAVAYDTVRPSGDQVFIKGTVRRRGVMDFGIGTYFVPEGTGQVIERAQDLKVKVAIDGGGAALIKEVLVDGQPFEPRAPDLREPRLPVKELPPPEEPQPVP